MIRLKSSLKSGLRYKAEGLQGSSPKRLTAANIVSEALRPVLMLTDPLGAQNIETDNKA